MRFTKRSVNCCECKHLSDVLLDSPCPISCGKDTDVHCSEATTLALSTKSDFYKNGKPGIPKKLNCPCFQERTSKFGDCRDEQVLELRQNYLLWPTTLAVEECLKLGKEWRFLWEHRFQEQTT